MGTLSSELGSHVEQLTDRPRVYADANVPAGLVAFMRERLKWDVMFVLEHDDLRRAADREHYRLARQLRRTLVTQDRDYFDERHFPAAESGGVIVVSAPDERALARVFRRIDRVVFRGRVPDRASPPPAGEPGLPLAGRKLHVHPGWTGREAPSAQAGSDGG